MTSLDVRPAGGALGADVFGVDLAEPLDDASFGALRHAFLQYGVLFVRDQKLGREAQLDLARRFGKPEIHPIANGLDEHPEIIRVLKPRGEEAFFGTSWHTDNSFFSEPSAMTLLYGEKIPPFGGDTVFASMERAYETLSEPIRELITPLRAVHSARSAYDPRTTGDEKYQGRAAISYTFSESIYEEVEHPVVRTHPETGRRSLYVNAMFTQRIVGLHTNESDALLSMLYAHATRPDFTCRLRWQPGTLAIWDNRCLQHYAINDYADHERLMYRVTISGTRPV